ncbi:hypothetical protein Pmani_012085 [Petrolisthes manimaculis]|uniref:SGNH hydrolase-type esterase domain-containing protein n=1 Tax=Petrolisthes manimaculis TaxID=1843537 RepID=A0AAE1Q1J7_9EUCA|nr:hypothetical protein Pmani_012085 [Petrolisthes manimaculis]
MSTTTPTITPPPPQPPRSPPPSPQPPRTPPSLPPPPRTPPSLPPPPRTPPSLPPPPHTPSPPPLLPPHPPSPPRLLSPPRSPFPTQPVSTTIPSPPQTTHISLIPNPAPPPQSATLSLPDPPQHSPPPTHTSPSPRPTHTILPPRTPPPPPLHPPRTPPPPPQPPHTPPPPPQPPHTPPPPPQPPHTPPPPPKPPRTPPPLPQSPPPQPPHTPPPPLQPPHTPPPLPQSPRTPPTLPPPPPKPPRTPPPLLQPPRTPPTLPPPPPTPPPPPKPPRTPPPLPSPPPQPPHTPPPPLQPPRTPPPLLQPPRTPPTLPPPPHRDAYAQSPLPTHSARSNISYCINDNQNEIDTNKTGRDIKNIHDKLVLKDMEIELLIVEVKKAYQLIASLQQRVTALEHHNIITSEGQRQVQALTPPVSHYLLLGDSNLRRVRTSDLGDNSSVKTIHGANVDLVRKRISEQLNNKAPTECVIYCGINDILDESPHEIILDNIGALVTDLKEKNCSMKIYVCQIVPPNNSHGLKENIESFNECLIKWGETNGIIIIKTTPNFKLGTGELDDLCFEGDENNAILSRIGIIRLLDTVTNQFSEFKLCKNWKQLKKSMKLTTVKTDKLVGGDTQHTNRRASHQPPATPASPPTVVQQPPPPLVNRAADPPPPPATSGLGAARPYIPRGPGTINYSPYPPHQGAAPPPPPLSATLHDAAWHSPPYTPATAPHYQPSEMHSGSSSRFHAHVEIPGNGIHHMPRDTASRGPPRIRGQMLGSNNARQFPPYQETRRAASNYPSNSGGFYHSWRPRGAPHGVPSAPYAVHSGRQLPATARHIIPSGWSRTKA